MASTDTKLLMRDLASMGGSDHSATQMDSFILKANGVTPYGMYKQALRQLHTLIRSVRGLRRELQHQEINERECMFKLANGFRDNYAQERCKLDEDEAKWNAIDLREKILSKQRELQHFHKRALELRTQLNLNMQDPAIQLAAEQAHWVELYRRDAALQLQTTGAVHMGLLRDINALPDKQRRLVLSSMQQEQLTEEEVCGYGISSGS